jgi:aminoglycoside phosphotransferase (APT) family kinase protein
MLTSAEAGAELPAPVALSRWVSNITGDPGPFTVQRLSGGSANENTLLRSPAQTFVLRQPPGSNLESRTHSIEREYRVMIALSDTHVPVPRPIGLSHRPLGQGPPALLLEYVDGASITGELPAGYDAASVATIAHASIDALADLHTLPWRELGLEGFGKPDHFLERQVGRWRSHYRAFCHRDLPDFDIVARWLEANRPPAGEAGLLHGDSHIDNFIFSRSAPARLLALIDWELSTIGDPLLDVGLLLALWGSNRAEPWAMPRIQRFSRSPGAPTREQLAQRYSRRSGRSLEHLSYYAALGLWKLAAIVEAEHLHFVTGRTTSPTASSLEHDVPRLLAEARWWTEGHGA